jgi:hypothetical protein
MYHLKNNLQKGQYMCRLTIDNKADKLFAEYEQAKQIVNFEKSSCLWLLIYV